MQNTSDFDHSSMLMVEWHHIPLLNITRNRMDFPFECGSKLLSLVLSCHTLTLVCWLWIMDHENLYLGNSYCWKYYRLMKYFLYLKARNAFSMFLDNQRHLAPKGSSQPFCINTWLQHQHTNSLYLSQETLCKRHDFLKYYIYLTAKSNIIHKQVHFFRFSLSCSLFVSYYMSGMPCQFTYKHLSWLKALTETFFCSQLRKYFYLIKMLPRWKWIRKRVLLPYCLSTD